MALSNGDKAPDFTLTTQTGEGPKLVTLSENFGKKKSVLLFFPMAFTGVCTKEFCDVSQGLSAYEALDAQVYGISGDNPFAQEAWAKKEGISVTLLSDYEHAAAKAYGVAYEQFAPSMNLLMGGVPKRSAFVIDKEGVVRYVESHDVPTELPDFEAIKACLQSL